MRPIYWLLVLVFLTAALSAAVPPDPAGWRSLYREDFESGILYGWAGNDDRFQVVKEGNNSVLAGEAHAKIRLSNGFWYDYRFKARVKLVDSTTISLGFRETNGGNYMIVFGAGSMSLSRDNPGTQLARVGESHPIGQWYVLETIGRGARIQVYLDGNLKFDVADANPVLGGGIALMVHQSGHALFDDLEVFGPPDSTGPRWVRSGGPTGGVGYDIRMRPDNPDVMFATDNSSGVSISEDGGRTWKQANSGIAGRAGTTGDAVPVFCLTIDPNNPDIVWAGTQNLRGIYRSTDGGKTWVQRDRGVVEKNGITFRGFAVDPRDSRIVYAAGEISSSAWSGQAKSGRGFDLTKGVVYKTSDGGENWTAIWRGDNLARYIWINPQRPDTLYVSTGFWDREAANTDVAAGYAGGVGILKSEDAGSTWQVLGMANGLKNLYVGSLFMHPADPDILLAGAASNAWPGDDGVYLTTDGGQTWRQTLSAKEVAAVEFSNTDPSVAYAATTFAFYRSADGGRTWQNMRPAGPSRAVTWGPPGVPSGIPVDLQVDPRNPNRVFSNSYKGGNALTEDGGRTWADASQGYTGANTHDVAVDPRDPGRVYAVTRSGPFRSENSGDSWDGLFYVPGDVGKWFPSGWLFPEWNSVAVDPGNPDRVLFADERDGAIFLSTERGDNWRVVFAHPETVKPGDAEIHGFQSFAFAPSNSRTVYAGMRRDRGTVDYGRPGPSFGIFKSADGGETWSAANDASTAALNVNVLAVDPNSEDIAYAGSTVGIYGTTDGGRNWKTMNTGLRVTNIRALAVDPTNANILYAGAWQGGLYKSWDKGGTWVLTAAGMDAGASILEIVIDRSNPRVLYAADLSSGVYRSSDGGALWVQINQGLTMRSVSALSLSQDGGTLYASTEGGGVFRMDTRPRVTSVSAASFETSGTLAPEAIASGFGTNLAAATEVATSLPLPTTLAGVSVSVTDSAGVERPAPLFFVSPGQINYLIPAGTALGVAKVQVQGNVGYATIEAVAPGLFTANSSGSGAPAAVAVRGAAQLPVYQCGAAVGSCVTTPIDLGAETDEVFLLLFGTGIRGGTTATARIGGIDVPVSYAGPQGGFVGLDQVNVKLPRTLAGRGEVDLVLTVDGKAANAVKVRIK